MRKKIGQEGKEKHMGELTECEIDEQDGTRRQECRRESSVG